MAKLQMEDDVIKHCRREKKRKIQSSGNIEKLARVGNQWSGIVTGQRRGCGPEKTFGPRAHLYSKKAAVDYQPRGLLRGWTKRTWKRRGWFSVVRSIQEFSFRPLFSSLSAPLPASSIRPPATFLPPFTPRLFLFFLPFLHLTPSPRENHRVAGSRAEAAAKGVTAALRGAAAS